MNNQNYTKLLKSVRDFIDRNYMEKEKLISFVDFRDRPKSRKDCSLHPVWQSVAPKPLAIIDAFSISISYLFFMPNQFSVSDSFRSSSIYILPYGKSKGTLFPDGNRTDFPDSDL